MNEFAKVLLDKWTGPAGILIMFGAIVWGVQLNFAVLALTDELAAQRVILERNMEQSNEVTLSVAKAATLLESLTRQLDILERRMTRNETWITRDREHVSP